MTSTNHFRNRRLSKSLSAPITPRHKPVHARGLVLPDAPLWMQCNYQWDDGGNSSTLLFDFQVPIQQSSNDWLWTGFDTQGHPIKLEASVNPSFHNAAIYWYLNLGGGFNLNAQVSFSPWSGTTPGTIGPGSWQLFTGTTMTGQGTIVCRDHIP